MNNKKTISTLNDFIGGLEQYNAEKKRLKCSIIHRYLMDKTPEGLPATEFNLVECPASVKMRKLSRNSMQSGMFTSSISIQLQMTQMGREAPERAVVMCLVNAIMNKNTDYHGSHFDVSRNNRMKLNYADLQNDSFTTRLVEEEKKQLMSEVLVAYKVAEGYLYGQARKMTAFSQEADMTDRGNKLQKIKMQHPISIYAKDDIPRLREIYKDKIMGGQEKTLAA